MKRINFVFVITALFFILGCTQQIEAPTTPPSVISTGGSEAAEETAVKEFTMTAKRFDFHPPTITVNKGEEVQLKITSIDVSHGFLLPDFDINQRLMPNQEVVIEFTADKEGTFPFGCNVPCGSGHSRMAGTLIVK